MKAAMLTFEQVRARLSVGKSTLYALLERGALTGVKVGSLWRVDPDDLETFINARKRGAPSSPELAAAAAFDADDDLPAPRYFQ